MNFVIFSTTKLLLVTTTGPVALAIHLAMVATADLTISVLLQKLYSFLIWQFPQLCTRVGPVVERRVSMIRTPMAFVLGFSLSLSFTWCGTLAGTGTRAIPLDVPSFITLVTNQPRPVSSLPTPKGGRA